MSPIVSRRIASTLLLSLAALAAAPAVGARESNTADTYGYTFRSHDVYSDGARSGKLDTFTEGARGAGPDRSDVSVPSARG